MNKLKNKLKEEIQAFFKNNRHPFYNNLIYNFEKTVHKKI